MSFTSHLLERASYSSTAWHESAVFPGVRYATRRTSLLQRIELTKKVGELINKHDFLKAGDPVDQLEVTLGELLVRRLYIEWGLQEIDGLVIDGKPADVDLLIAKGPEAFTNEVVEMIRSEIELSADERKNS
jgi:hypothetical protein